LVLRDVREDIRNRYCLEEEETVTFVRLQNPRGQYRDGVRLRNGVELSLQNLPPGQHLDVLQLSPEIAERGAQDEAAFTQQAFGV
jgi:hypothetical protein